MTKDELKAFAAMNDEIDTLRADIERQKEAVREMAENRKKWHETIIMSSADEACRPVNSRVVSSAKGMDEAQARNALDASTHKLLMLIGERNDIELGIQRWLDTIPDWRVREILRKRYVEGWPVKSIAAFMGFQEGSIMNKESLFWKNK